MLEMDVEGLTLAPYWLFLNRAACCIATCMSLSCRLKDAGLTANPVNHSGRIAVSGCFELFVRRISAFDSVTRGGREE
jgi:hypothetical protein